MESKHLRMALLTPENHPGDYSGGLTFGGVPGVTCEKFGVLRARAGQEGDSSCRRQQPQATPPPTTLGAAVNCLHILKHPLQRASSCSPDSPGPCCRCTTSQVLALLEGRSVDATLLPQGTCSTISAAGSQLPASPVEK